MESVLMTSRIAGEELYISLRGEWVVAHVRQVQRVLGENLVQAAGLKRVIFQGEGLEALDTAGAWILYAARRDLARTGLETRLEGLKPEYLDFYNTVTQIPGQKAGGKQAAGGFFPAMEALGRFTVQGLAHLGEAFAFIGRLFVTLFASLLQPKHLRFSSIVRHIDETGIRAVPIVAMMAFLISVVLAYQGATQLGRFGAEIFTIDLTVISILREMGVLLTAILVAGRSGSAFAAEIGVMKLREEVDALNALGIDPYEVLVLPRVLALMIALPLLTLVANFAGLAGGAMMSLTLLDISLHQHLQRVHEIFSLQMFFVGMIKAPVFAFIIATVGTFRGMNVSGSAESVGRYTTIAVVESIFLVILADALFSVIFSELDI